MEYCSVMQFMERVSTLPWSCTGTSGISSAVGSLTS